MALEVQVQRAEKIQNNWVGSSMAFPLLDIQGLGRPLSGNIWNDPVYVGQRRREDERTVAGEPKGGLSR